MSSAKKQCMTAGNFVLKHVASALAIITLTAGGVAQLTSAPSIDYFARYERFVGATSGDPIPTVTLALADSYYNVAYTIGPGSSLLVATSKASRRITRTTYHDQAYAEEVDENGAVSRDEGSHLKDLVTLEALITGRAAFDRPVAQSLFTARIVVPGGWPVDLHIAGSGRMFQAIIYGSENHFFYPLRYSPVGSGKIITSWMLDGRDFRAASVQTTGHQIDAPPSSLPDWRWHSLETSWTQSFVPYDNRPTIPISVNGITSRCVLDTGTGGIVLPPSLVARAKVEQIASAPLNGLTSKFTASYGRADVIVGPAKMQSAVVFVDPRLSGDVAACGYDFLASFVVRIAKRRVTVAERPAIVPPCNADCIPIDTWWRTAVASIRLGSTPVWATLDTGFSGALVVASSPFELGDRTHPACHAHLSTEVSLTIGSVVVGPTPTCYAPLDAMLDPTHRADVGSAVLLRNRVELDLGNHEVRFDR